MTRVTRGRAPFDESDLRHANRGGARISAAQIAAILDRRRRIERALRSIAPERRWRTRKSRSLASADAALRCLRGHLRCRFLEDDEAWHRSAVRSYRCWTASCRRTSRRMSGRPCRSGSARRPFVGSSQARPGSKPCRLAQIQRDLADRGYPPLTAVRILDLLLWSAYAPARRSFLAVGNANEAALSFQGVERGRYFLRTHGSRGQGAPALTDRTDRERCQTDTERGRARPLRSRPV